MGYAKRVWEEEMFDGESRYQEEYERAQGIYSMDELGKEQGWTFVRKLVTELGKVPDICCCCIGKTAQGAYEQWFVDQCWREAVVATVKAYPNG